MTEIRTVGTRRQQVAALVHPPDLTGTVAVVTGGTDGVGRALVERLAGLQATVVLTARNAAKGERVRSEIVAATGNDDVHVVDLDLADLRSVRRGAAEVMSRWPKIGLFVANAAHEGKGDRTLTVDGFETTFAVNHLAHALLVQDLTDAFRSAAPSTIVIVASEAHRRSRGGLDFDDLMMERGTFKPRVAYSRSKLANILYARELAVRLEGSGVVVHAAHPGAVDTPMMRQNFERPALRKLYPVLRDHVFVTPDQAAQGILRVALDPRLAIASGDYYELGRPNTPNDLALDDGSAEQLWAATESLLAGRISALDG